ncbi:hypothetical protein KUCAC02_037255, partial [Chaenocephalus aceratus]
MSVCCCRMECPSSRRTTRQEGESLPARGGLQSADSVPAAGTTRYHIQSAGALLLLQTFPRKGSRPPRLFLPKPADLPPVSNVASSPRTSTAPLHLENPIRIHNRSVPGRSPASYSLGLGRRIKQKLWERLDRPMFTETVDEDGLVHVDVSYGAGVQPPLHNVDVSVFLIQLQPQQQQYHLPEHLLHPPASTCYYYQTKHQPCAAACEITDSSPPTDAVSLLPPSSTSSFSIKLLPHSSPAASVSNLQILTGHCGQTSTFSHLKKTTPPEDPHRSCGQTSTFSLYKETCTDVILLPCGDLSGTARTRETHAEIVL